MRILIAAAEVAPRVVVGGVAEYTAGLARALVARGHDVTVVVPGYGHLSARGEIETILPRLPVPLGVGATEVTSVRRIAPAAAIDPEILLVGRHRHFDSTLDHADIYRWPNPEPWFAFSRAVVALVEAGIRSPDVVHCQDAHTALVPVFVRQSGATGVPVVLTAHNLLDQGRGDPGLLTYAGLPETLFDIDGFEFHGIANALKAGVLCASRVSAVSRTWARDITTPEGGFGLDGVFRRCHRDGRLRGIVNGIDEARWSVPGVDHGAPDVESRVASWRSGLRARLFASWDWSDSGEPVVGFRARWDSQKGIDILMDALPHVLGHARVLLCTWGFPGDESLAARWPALQALARSHPDRLLVNPPGIARAEDTASHYGCADLMLMPSRYEPCGLVQLECQRFGCIPIVRATGGLVDTVGEGTDVAARRPNGIVFPDYDADSLFKGVERALDALADPHRRRTLISNCLAQRNGWSDRVLDYEALYADAIAAE